MMKTFVIYAGEEELSDLERLEQIYKKVRLNKLVKFQGKAYRRIVPKNNKSFKYPYHFWCVSKNIYEGSCLTEDADGEYVNILCDYSVVLELGGK